MYVFYANFYHNGTNTPHYCLKCMNETSKYNSETILFNVRTERQSANVVLSHVIFITIPYILV